MHYPPSTLQILQEMSSYEVIDIDLDEAMPPPFALRVMSFGESQVGALQTVVDSSYELCKILGK